MKIGIIGAGPRGLSVAERILHNNQDRHSLELFLFDPNGPGGRVWRLNQPPELLMNSVSQQVTLFTDETLSSGGLVTQGPNLFQWSKGPATDYIEQTVTKNKQLIIEEINRLEKDQQSTRCLYGLYQRWFFSKLQEEFLASIQFVYSLVKKVSKRKDGYLLQTDQQSYSIDQLVLASGHWENDETEEERVWVDYAKKNVLLYQLPSNPADVDLSKIPPKENVFLRGLGFSFFDYVGLFTVSRGGRFENEKGKLVYHPSGKEPIVYSGSRRGLPYYPRGRNQKQGGAMAWPRLLTKENLEQWHQSGFLTGETFFDYLKKDVELFYYKKIIEEYHLPIPKKNFEHDFLSLSSEECLGKHPALIPYRWDWSYLETPLAYQNEPFSEASRIFIEGQIKEAEKGNCTGAFASTFDALKDWRDPIRQAIEWHVFSAKEYKEILWGWFTHLNSFLTIGPPIIRTKELAALIDAGIFHLIEPPFDIQQKHNRYVISLQDKEISSRYLIEARLPQTSFSRSSNPVIKNLKENKLVRPFSFSDNTGSYHSEAIDVERGTNRVIDASGEIQSDFYCYGIPVEGVDWLTAAVARPYTDPWNLRQADKIAQLILTDK